MRFIHKYFEKHNTTVTIWIISCTEIQKGKQKQQEQWTLLYTPTRQEWTLLSVMNFLLTVMERSVSGQKWSHSQKWNNQLLNFWTDAVFSHTPPSTVRHGVQGLKKAHLVLYEEGTVQLCMVHVTSLLVQILLKRYDFFVPQNLNDQILITRWRHLSDRVGLMLCFAPSEVWHAVWHGVVLLHCM